MTDKHTPTPWVLSEEDRFNTCDIVAVSDQMNNGYRIAGVEDGPESNANAKHIVKCVNMHEELIEDLQELKAWVDFNCKDLDTSPAKTKDLFMDNARKAIEKARGTPND